MSDRDRAISDLAYQIWEQAGRPEGQDDRHWHEAQRRYDADHAGAASKATGAASGPSGLKASAKTKTPPVEPAAPKTVEPPRSKGKAKKPAADAPAPKAAPRAKR